MNAVLERCARMEYVILTNQLLVDEFADTATKPRLLDKIDWDAYDDILALLAACGEEVGVTRPFPECRDEEDRYLLGMAQAGDADYLVTSDQDLLCLGAIGKCRMVTPEQFAAILGV